MVVKWCQNHSQTKRKLDPRPAGDVKTQWTNAEPRRLRRESARSGTQLHTLFLCLSQQLLSQRPLIHFVNHLTLSVLHAMLTLGESDQDQIHRCSDSPAGSTLATAGGWARSR
jgi:hypothetical protein